MAKPSMSEKRASEPTPLGRFLEQYSKDLESQVFRTLDEYLALFPGDSDHVAEEYLALKRFREQVDEDPKSAIPVQISHYRIVRELGRGGQGVVYLAKDMKLGREVAIKMLRRSRLAIDELERLQREARIASRLDHPGICPIYDIGDYGGEPYVVMRYVKGTSLSHRISQNKETTATTLFVDVSDADASSGTSVPASIEPPKSTKSGPVTPSGKDLHSVLRLIEQVARALHEAHEAQIVHRDVKPGNIVVTPEGQPVLLDFGVATMAQDGGVVVTRTGETPGTPQYMSPEQTSGNRVQLDRRTDVYSLGVTLYECLTLKLPFSDKSDFARQIMFSPVPDPRSLNPAISKDLKVVIETALEKDRNRRYATAAEFADDLRRVRDHEPIRARPIGLTVRFARWVQRKPALAAALITVILTLATGLIAVTAALNQARNARDSEHGLRIERDRALAVSEPLADLKQLDDLSQWSDDLWPSIPKHLDGARGMKKWIERAGHLLGRRRSHESALSAVQNGDGDLSPEERENRIAVLTELVGKLDGLPVRIQDMEGRADSASTFEERTILAPRDQWEDVKKDLLADPRFASISPLNPQPGLIPIGKNAAGLHEFAVVETGFVPRRRSESDSRPAVEAAAFVVLVPGGTLRFDSGPDQMARTPSPSDFQTTQVAPCFVGKHEITQRQYVRVMGSNPSVVKERGVIEAPADDRHPVDSVTWWQSREFCRRVGVRLPTQDEWEIVARSLGGAEYGDSERIESLEGRENLRDASYLRKTGRNQAGQMPWDDDYVFSAPVGSFRPNGFGLYDVIGNVSEWCSDRVERGARLPSVLTDSRSTDKPLDRAERRRVSRGGSWLDGSRESSCRYVRPLFPEHVSPSLGFRIARSVDR